jgi:hypothetical protein
MDLRSFNTRQHGDKEKPGVGCCGLRQELREIWYIQKRSNG